MLMRLLLTALAWAQLGAAQTPMAVEVSEETRVGEVIGNLKSRFSLPDGSTFAISFPTEETRRLFQLDSNTGEIRTQDKLDREALCPGSKSSTCERGFNAEVRRGDTGDDEIYSVRVIVRDINDQRPQFHPKDKPFRISIAESDTPPSFYSLPQADDADSSGHDSIVYSLSPKGEAGQYFRLAPDERTGGRSVPRLELIRPLDREAKDTYELELFAGDSEFREDRDKTDVLVRVLDANDNRPQIRLTTRSLVVSECDELRRPLLRLEATDADEDKRVRFSVARTATPEVAGAFYIADDYLRQNRSLDFETVGSKILYVPLVAEDYGGLKSEAEVEVRVTDCNDHFPNISLHIMDATVTENDPAEKLLARVMVRDEDDGDNGTVECSVAEPRRGQFELSHRLTDGPHQTFYRLRKLAGAKFDREATPNGEVTIELVCRDRGRPTPKERRRELKIRVLDENDNPPTPERQLYRFRVRENQPAGTFVGRVSASDRDSGDNGRITFRLDAQGEQFFSLQPKTPMSAEIHTRLTFDRETRDRYTFAVTAEDNGAKERLTATISVEVLVEDEDDSAPVFRQREYSFRVPEDFGRNSTDRLIGEVEATDSDAGYNAEIRYEVGRVTQSGDSSGVFFHFRGNRLYARGNLDRERQEAVSLDLLALNRGPQQHRGVALATVTLLDVNDNWPELVGVRRTYNLSDSSPAGTQVLQLAGVDRDAGENGSVSYSLVGTDHGHFSVDSAHGIVTLVRGLKGSSGGGGPRVFRLVVRATDGGRPALRSPDESLFISVLSGEFFPDGVGGGAGGVGGGGSGQVGGNSDSRSQRSDADRHFLVLLCLAGAVFFIFLLLLGVLIYVHRRGGRDASGVVTRESQGVWYDKANADATDDPPDCSEFRYPDVVKAATADSPTTLTLAQPQTSRRHPCEASSAASGTLVIDNAGARSPSRLMRDKFPSFGYLAEQDSQQRHQQQQRPQFQLLTLRSCNGYESFQRRQQLQQQQLGSDRLPRKVYGPRLESDAASGGEEEYRSLQQQQQQQQRVQENRYATNSQARVGVSSVAGQDPLGYAMLSATGDATGGTLANPVVCKTPYMTSSFV